MEAHWQEAMIGEKGMLVLNDLPFEPGKAVDVLIIPRSVSSSPKSLQNSVLAYDDPYEPVAAEDWELQL
jgi:hypothetical protein